MSVRLGQALRPRLCERMRLSIGEHGIPYGYSPVIARKAGEGAIDAEVVRRFVKATREGYELAVKDANAGVAALKPHCRPEREEDFLRESQKQINAYYSDGSQLGTMSAQKWKSWTTWLEEHKLMAKDAVATESLFTNEFGS